jgi:very long chain acyl-CoA dehydrogenase
MVLIKYGKGIVDEQFILNRLANSAIDVYTSAVVLSRASTSLDKGLPTANHEKLMTEAWVLEACERVDANLKAIATGKNLDNFTKLSHISKNICESTGVAQLNPLNF